MHLKPPRTRAPKLPTTRNTPLARAPRRVGPPLCPFSRIHLCTQMSMPTGTPLRAVASPQHSSGRSSCGSGSGCGWRASLPPGATPPGVPEESTAVRRVPPGGFANIQTMRHRTLHANGIDVHVAEAGDGPPVILLHGFPELWYSWRHQLPALAARDGGRCRGPAGCAGRADCRTRRP